MVCLHAYDIEMHGIVYMHSVSFMCVKTYCVVWFWDVLLTWRHSVLVYCKGGPSTP